MLFPTIEFALFFMLVLPCTWLLNRRNELKKAMLVVASYVFYSFWSVPFLLLLFLSSLFNYAFGLLIGGTVDPKLRKVLTGLVKRIAPSATASAVGTPDDVAAYA